jgi:NAD+ synthase
MSRPIQLPYIDPATTKREISDFIIDTVRSGNGTGAVIGLSGGVDSTTTAALAKHAFDAYNAAHGTDYELVGYILPSKSNNPADTEDGVKVAERLGIRHEVHNLEPLVQAYAHTNPEALESKFDKGNMTSRIRGTVLNTKSSTERKTLLGTGNKDEDFGIGYYTLFGDGAVHCSPIGGLSKRLVREMAAYLNFEDLAYREPTAGLEPGQTDFKDLGYKYDLVELVSEGLEQGFTREELATHKQIVPLVEEQAALYASKYGSAKFTDAKDVVEDIAARNASAKRKASIIHPPGPALTMEYR